VESLLSWQQAPAVQEQRVGWRGLSVEGLASKKLAILLDGLEKAFAAKLEMDMGWTTLFLA
jgi:hypothetical protein